MADKTTPRDTGTKHADAGSSGAARQSDFDRHEAASHLLEQTERILAEVRGLGIAIKEEAGGAWGSARRAGSDAMDRGKERARNAREDVKDYVERQPLKSLLFAAGIGLLIGFLSRRR